jgi:hypothetical protein
MDDRTTMNGKAVYHFKVFGIRAVVFVEAEIQMDDEEEHLNAIAQLIAECCGQAAFRHRICYLLLILFNPTACECNNKQFDVSIPIFCVLYYRSTFRFFTFDGSIQVLDGHRLRKSFVCCGRPSARRFHLRINLTSFHPEPPPNM